MRDVEYRNFGDIGLGYAPDLAVIFSEKTLELSWPAPASDFTLQMSSDLNNPNGWVNVPKVLVIFDGRNCLNLSVASASRFYRLSQ